MFSVDSITRISAILPIYNRYGHRFWQKDKKKKPQQITKDFKSYLDEAYTVEIKNPPQK